MEDIIEDFKKEYFRVACGRIEVPMICNQCGEKEWIDRDDWERYWAHDQNDYTCSDCQL